MEKYFMTKCNYKQDSIYFKCNFDGYKVSPKNNISYDGITISEMIIIKPSLIEKIIKRKIKYKLDLFLTLITDNEGSDDDTRKALDDLQRYKKFVNKKYKGFLDKKYMTLLMKKINVMEKELKQQIVYKSVIIEDEEIKKNRYKCLFFLNVIYIFLIILYNLKFVSC